MNTIDNQSITHQNTESTGKKPAKPEMKNKLNMTMKPQYPYNPHPENQISQMNQWFRQPLTGNCIQPAKTNIIDNQSLTHQNAETTGKKPAKPEMNNKQNINPNHSTAICKSVAGLPLNTVNLFQDDTQPTSCKS